MGGLSGEGRQRSVHVWNCGSRTPSAPRGKDVGRLFFSAHHCRSGLRSRQGSQPRDALSARPTGSQKMEPPSQPLPQLWKSLPCSKEKQPECNTGKRRLGWTTSTKPAGQAPEKQGCSVAFRGLWTTGIFFSSSRKGHETEQPYRPPGEPPGVDPFCLESDGIIREEPLAQ